MKTNVVKVIFIAFFAMIAGYCAMKMETRNLYALASLVPIGCVNGPNVWGYCIVEGDKYTCQDYWIWNCVTAVNKQ